MTECAVGAVASVQYGTAAGSVLLKDRKRGGMRTTLLSDSDKAGDFDCFGQFLRLLFKFISSLPKNVDLFDERMDVAIPLG
jgi:hypothetical protein